MKNTRVLFLCCALLAGVVLKARPVVAATYHVASNGDDTRSTLQAQAVGTPWKTLQKAAAQAVAGDLVKVAPGTYFENVTLKNQHGKANSWIRFVAASSAEKPKIVGAGKDGYGNSVTIQDSSYIEFDGFELTTPEVQNSVGIGIERSHHITVRNCIAHSNGQSGIGTMHSDYLLIENNLCYNNSFTGIWHGSGISLYQNQKSDDAPGFHSIVRNNICHSNTETDAITTDHTDGNGIIIDDFQNTQAQGNGINYVHATLVENNLCYNNGAKGIQVYLSDYVTVRNNTCYFNNRDSGTYSAGTWRGELNHSQSSHNTWLNNIGYSNLAYNKENRALMIGAYNNYQSVGNVFRNNLTFQVNGAPGTDTVRVDLNGKSEPLVTAENGNLLGLDPQFVNPGAYDFRLRDSSPAHKVGTLGFSSNAAPVKQ